MTLLFFHTGDVWLPWAWVLREGAAALCTPWLWWHPMELWEDPLWPGGTAISSLPTVYRSNRPCSGHWGPHGHVKSQRRKRMESDAWLLGGCKQTGAPYDVLLLKWCWSRADERTVGGGWPTGGQCACWRTQAKTPSLPPCLGLIRVLQSFKYTQQSCSSPNLINLTSYLSFFVFTEWTAFSHILTSDASVYKKVFYWLALTAFSKMSMPFFCPTRKTGTFFLYSVYAHCTIRILVILCELQSFIEILCCNNLHIFIYLANTLKCHYETSRHFWGADIIYYLLQ